MILRANDDFDSKPVPRNEVYEQPSVTIVGISESVNKANFKAVVDFSEH